MNSTYEQLINRNIGLLTPEQQEKINQSCVVVCGTGGLGGLIAEMMARIGVGKIKLIDWGTFEPTNLNRQNFCFTDTLDMKKTDVTEVFLKKINPELIIEKYDVVTEENVDAIMEGATLAHLCIDQLIPILILSRKCRELEVPLVEGWAAMYANARVFTKDTVSLEEAYEMPTIGRNVSDISKEESKEIHFRSMMYLTERYGLMEVYPPAVWTRFQTKGEMTTLVPLVWMTCTLMAMESVKVILEIGKVALAPDFIALNPYYNEIPIKKK